MLHWSDLFSQALLKRKKKVQNSFLFLHNIICDIYTPNWETKNRKRWNLRNKRWCFPNLMRKKLCHVLKKLKFSLAIMFKHLTLMLVWQSWYNLFGSSSSQIVDMCICDILWCLPRSGFSGDHLSHKTMKGGEEGKASSTYILMSEQMS